MLLCLMYAITIPLALHVVQEYGPHFPTAFTEHFPPVHAAKYELGRDITTATNVVVLHANLPKYGLSWHKEPMKGIWDEWLQPYLGNSLSDPALHRTVPPRWWLDEHEPYRGSVAAG